LKDFARREEVVLATKVYQPMGTKPNRGGLSRKYILHAIDDSLRRLGTDYVDLYQIHRWDKETPMEETLEVLHDVVKSGKARYLGASSMWAWQFAQVRGRSAFACSCRITTTWQGAVCRLPRPGMRDSPARGWRASHPRQERSDHALQEMILLTGSTPGERFPGGIEVATAGQRPRKSRWRDAAQAADERSSGRRWRRSTACPKRASLRSFIWTQLIVS
jgi:hypothetical protein